ncbi:hypothetical protein MTO96_020216 [Rhipicephalus appendiculatus]
MNLILSATGTALGFYEALTIIDPLQVHDLDLTNCVIAAQDGLCEYVALCSNLQSLKCVACPILVSKLLWLLEGRLPQLEKLAFSLSLPHSEINKEIGSVLESLRQVPRKTASNLRTVYVEMWGDENGRAPPVAARPLSQCDRSSRAPRKRRRPTLFAADGKDLADEPFPTTLFNKHALVCANVSVCDEVYNCVWLRDLVLDPTHREPFAQLVVVFDKTDDLAHRIAEAARGHDWTDVCCLTIVLAAQQPFVLRPMAEGLNITSFHFGVDIDVTRLLCDAGLVSLRALSTPPCGLSHRHAVRRLADACPQLVELDVRVEQCGTQLGCTVCQQLELRLDDGDMIALQKHDPPRSRRRLNRLTLSGVLRLQSLLFLAHCKVDELRLVDCTDVSVFLDIGELLAQNERLFSLLLRNTALPFGTSNFLDNMTRATRLQYLCLLTDVPVPEDIAEAHVKHLADGLPQLICVHVHYRSMENGREQRITWLRDTVEIAREGHLFRDGPCIICSTATFVALAKPQNRDCLM